jgi:EmrB/QacA subfamily drug resistance transporter
MAEVARLPEATRKRLVLLACILGSSIVFLDATVVNVALPAIQRDLGGGLTLQQWVVDAYLLTLGSLILLGGSLGDLFGERRVFLAGTALFGLTSVGCALAPTGPALIAGRALQGAAGALLTPSSLAVITTTFSGEERGAAIGTWTAGTGVATVVGPLLGGWLVSAASWRSIFLLNVPLVAATLVTIMVALPAQPAGRARARVDVVGAALCTAGLGGPVFALIEGPRRGFGDPLVLAALLGGVACLGAFVAWELRHPEPMLPPRLFRRRNFTFANVETVFAYGALYLVIFLLTLFLQQIAGYSPFHAGLALLPTTIVMFTLSRSAGRLSMRIGPRPFMAGGPLVCAGGVAWLLALEPRPSYWSDLLPPLVLLALGLSALVAPLTSTVLAEASAGDAGIASAVNNALARVAGLLAIAIGGVAATGASGELSLHGARVGFGIAAALLVAAGLVGLVGIRNPPPTVVPSRL